MFWRMVEITVDNDQTTNIVHLFGILVFVYAKLLL